MNFCIFGVCCFYLYSPLPLGPRAGGVWAAHSACRLAHTVPGWSCSPGPGSLHPGPGVSLRLACSCGCGTTPPCRAAPRLGPRGLGGVEGWATGPPGPGHLPLQLQTQQLLHRPRGASGRPRKALEGQRCFKKTNGVTLQYYSNVHRLSPTNPPDLLMSKRSFFGLSAARGPLCPLGPCVR